MRTPLEPWIVHRAHLSSSNQEALRAHQLAQLKHRLTYAKAKSAFYANRLSEIDVDAITSLNDFEQIGFTTPEDIQRAAHAFACVPAHDITRIVTLCSSGTTGEEKRIFFTDEDLESTIDFFEHGMRCLVDESDVVMVLLPGASYGSIGDLLHNALTRSGIVCVVHGILNDVEAAAQCIIDNHVTCLVGIPMQVRYLSLMKPESFGRISKVLLSTDYVPEILVKELEERFTCKVFNHYGMTEMGYGGGVECACLNGYHLRENDLYVEVIDPFSGEVVEDGVYGEVVFTTLNRQAMPLIRYRTGDRARFLRQPCACGTFLRTLERVQGRMENSLSVDGHALHLRDVDEVLLGIQTIVDYTMSVYETSLHVTLKLSQNACDERVKKEVEVKIRTRFPFVRDVCIETQKDDHSLAVTNSMIKRKLRDCRQGVKR